MFIDNLLAVLRRNVGNAGVNLSLYLEPRPDRRGFFMRLVKRAAPVLQTKWSGPTRDTRSARTHQLAACWFYLPPLLEGAAHT